MLGLEDSLDSKLAGIDGSLTYDRGSDGVVIPGLIDGHCHVVGGWQTLDPHQPGYRERLVLWGAGAAQAVLAAGITTVGDCGAPDDSSLRLREAIDAGYLVGPRLVVCGPSLTTTAGHGDYPQARSVLQRALASDGCSAPVTLVERCTSIQALRSH